MSSTQLFRTSLNGYKKEDVNDYIIAINNELTAVSTLQNKLSDELCSVQRKTADEIAHLNTLLKSAEQKLSELSSVQEENLQLKEQISLLRAEKEDAEKKLADGCESIYSSTYDNLCAKAGEVLVIASTTADSILKKANDEANRIISDASDKKDSMFKDISETASTAADGLSDYIKNAVDECIGKINSSIRRVEALKNAPEEKIPVFKIDR